MRTRGLVAAGLTAAAMMMLVGAAGAQEPFQPEEPGVFPETAPRADEPLVTRLPEPTLSVEGGIGILGFTGGAANAGPTWNVRVTGIMSPRFALEANYIGSANVRPVLDETLVMTNINGAVRYNVLRADEAIVQAFVSAGLGYVGWSGEGGDPAALAIPLGVGVERLVTRNIKVGARFNLTPALFDDLSVPGGGDVGGDTWSLSAQAGGAF